MEAALTPKVVAIEAAAEAFGIRLKPVLDLLRSSLDKAVTCESTPDESRTLDLRSKLSSHFELVEDMQETLSDTDLLSDHISVIAEASAALGWVVSDDPSGHMSAVTEETEPIITALRAKPDPSHGLLADSVDQFIKEVSDYVVDNHKNPLSFTESTDSNEEHSASHLKDFRNTVTDAAVLDFQKASESLSGNDETHPIALLSQLLTNAMNGVYDFIVTASSIPEKPSDEDRQAMLSTIISHISSVNAKVADMPPSDPFFNHAKSIEDSLTMLSWIVADAKPTSFISEAETAAGFYLNKILMSSKNTPDASKHRAFVDAMNGIFVALRKYIKDQHPTGLRYGIGVSAPKTPTSTVNGVHHGNDNCEEDDNASGDNYVSKFNDILTGPLSRYVKASEEIGGELAVQTKLFAEAWNEEAKFLASAYKTSAPNPDDLQSMVLPIGQKMGEIASISEAADPRGPLTQHLMAVSESAAALGWVAVDEKATAFVGESSEPGQFYIGKVRMGARKTDKPEAHREWAKALEELWKELKAYVKEHHTQRLVWNPPKARKVTKRIVAVEDDDDSDSPATYVSLFRDLINGPLSSYVASCNTIGGEVAKQAEVFKAAWKAEEEFLGKAYNMTKPADIQEMLMPIGTKMGEVSSMAQDADPRGPLTQHLMAVSESVAALGWVAVDEKATSFVGESSEPGQFYIGKVRMGARKTNNPEAHREWAKALEELWKALKAYVKEHHTQKLVWNPPKVKKAAKRGVIVDDEDDEDTAKTYVSAFNDLITGSLAGYLKACNTIGGDLARQGEMFLAAWKAEEEILVKAYNMSKPEDIQEMLMAIGTKMGEVSSIAQDADPRGALTQHLMAVSESVSALGWVAVDEKATAFVGDSSEPGQFYIGKVRMGARKTDNPEAHREWAKALEGLWKDLKAYVKEYHTQKLVWNPPKAKKPSKRSVAVEDDDDGDNGTTYVSAFSELISGPLSTYMNSCKTIGGEVGKQAEVFMAAWKAEEEFLGKAYNMTKPADIQEMLMPIGTKMGEVSSMAQDADPRGPLTQHLMAVSESVAALGWVAVDEKATSFVGESSEPGQFYIGKVRMGARKTNNPEAHREWAKALEELWKALKAYVKEHHTQKLVWNPPKKSIAKAVGSSKVVVDGNSGPLDSVGAFKNLMDGRLASFVSICNSIGGDVSEQAKIFENVWQAEFELIQMAKSKPKPADGDAFQELMSPIGSKMGIASQLAEAADPRGPLTQHLMAVSESIGALGWVAVDEKATSYVGEMASTGQFYINKVKMSARKSDRPAVHLQWADALESLFSDLKAYVKEYHTQRLSWKK